MPERTLEQLKKGRAAAVARREPWLSSWRDAYRYTLPQRDIMDAPRPGQVKGNLVFDSTAVNSIAQGANRMQAAMMPPFQDLIIVEAGGAVPKEIKQQVDEKLSEAGEKFHGNLHRSNFAVAINEWLLDLFIGTATMLFLEGPDDDPFRFVPVAMPTVALEEGPWGSIGAHYRDHKVPLPVFREQWPEAKVPDGWMNKAKEDPAVEVPFHEVTYPDYREATWYYTLWSEEEDQILIDPHRAYDVHSPWLTARWTKAANEVYGRGPVLYALADIRTTNRVIELLLQNASLTVGGAYTVTHDGVVNPNTIRILPGAFIPVARNTGHPQGPSIAPLERTGDFDLAAFVLQDMRVNIKRMLFDRSLPEQTGQPRTATEIIELLKEVQTEQAPAFARIMKEFIVPFAHRGFQIMHKKGQIQFPIEVDGQVIQIRVSSPLARAQHLDDLQNVVQGVEIVGGLFGPEVLASSLKVEEAPAYMYSKLGIDPALIRGEGDRQQIRNQIVERIAGMVAQAQGATGGNGASMGAAPAAGTA